MSFVLIYNNKKLYTSPAIYTTESYATEQAGVEAKIFAKQLKVSERDIEIKIV